MNTNTTTVDWNAYAEKYDMLLTYNPFYQEALREVLSRVRNWNIKAGDQIADVGAGTGNYSVEVARLFPQAQIFHIDADQGMNTIAAKKATRLDNFQVLRKSVEQVNFATGSLQGLLCINAIYTFPNPQAELQKMYRWMAPGSHIVLIDAGRIMNVRSWTLALTWRLFRKYG